MTSLSPYDPASSDLSTQRSANGQRPQPAPAPSVHTPVASDFSALSRVFRRWPVAVAFAVVFSILGFISCHFMKTWYQSDAEVQLETPNQPAFAGASSQLAALSGLMGLGSGPGDLPTVSEVMTSDKALREVENKVGTGLDPTKERPLITLTPHKTSPSIIMMAVRASSPKIAQATIYALVNTYNAHMEDENSTGTGRLIGTTKEQLAGVTAKLTQSENEYASYSKQVGSVDIDAESTAKVNQLYTLRKELLDTQIDLSSQQSRSSDYQSDVTHLSPSMVPSLVLAPSPLIQSDQTKLSDLLQQRSSLSSQYTAQDQEMIQNQKQIDSVRDDIRQEVLRESQATGVTSGSLDPATGHEVNPQSSGYIVQNVTHTINPLRETAKEKLADARAGAYADNVQIGVLNDALANAQSDISSEPDKIRRLVDLKNDCTVYQKLYGDLQAQLVELNSQRPADQSYATILQLPDLPKTPVSPRVVLYSVAAGFFGLLVGLFLLFFLDSQDGRLRGTEDVANLTGVPVLQVLPYGPNSSRGKLAAETNKRYQRLASTLSFQGLGTKTQTLLLTSATSNEGSSAVAAKLAQAFAAAGRRVILVDATGPQPRIVPLGIEPIIRGSVSDPTEVGLAVKNTNVEPVNMNSLLKSNEAGAVIEQLKHFADIVIFDAPAILDDINTSYLTDKIDSILYVSKVAGPTRDEVNQALNLILGGSASVLGVVLNDSNL